MKGSWIFYILPNKWQILANLLQYLILRALRFLFTVLLLRLHRFILWFSVTIWWLSVAFILDLYLLHSFLLSLCSIFVSHSWIWFQTFYQFIVWLGDTGVWVFLFSILLIFSLVCPWLYIVVHFVFDIYAWLI